MSRFRELEEKVRRGDPLPHSIDWLLASLTPLTRLGMRWRMRQPRVRVDARVVSIGNVTAGGTGKTPAVIERARAEVAAGRRVAVLTRGYGSAKTSGVLTADSGTPGDEVARLIGDEPALILMKVPEARVVKCADRVAAAREAVDGLGCDTLILDDGFQYVQLERDENVVLVDGTNPFGNERLIPRGVLREPLSALRRATAFVVTRCDQAEDVAGLVSRLDALAPGVPVRLTQHAPAGFWRLGDGARMPLEWIRGREVDAACAIGRPEAFLRTLEALGAVVVERRIYRDHAAFDGTGLGAERPGIVTEKDAVRLAGDMGGGSDEVYALEVELRDWVGA